MKTVLRLALMLLLVSPAMYAAVPNYVPTNGLVGWWPFNGNSNDESGNGNNGTVNGPTLTIDRNGNPNSAYYFNNNHIQLPQSFGFTCPNREFTISFWFNSSFTGNPQQYFFDMRFGNGRRIVIDKFNGLDFSMEGGCGDAINGPGISGYSNSWTSMIGVFRNDSMFLYLNGIKVASKFVNYACPSPLIFSSGACGNCGNEIYRTIGGTDNLYPNQFTIGSLDDIGIWNRALSSSEIQQLYQSQTLCTLATNIFTQDTLSGCGNLILLDAGNPGSSYLWSTGATTQTINATISGWYRCTVSQGAVCSVTDSVYASLPNSLPVNLQTGLVGYWPFCGNANDESGNGNNGTAQNGVTLTQGRSNIPSSAYDFDGNDDQIYVNHSSSISPSQYVTVNSWIYPRAYEDGKFVCVKGSHVNLYSRSYGLLGAEANQKAQFRISNSIVETGVYSVSNIPLNTWSMITGVYDGNNIKIYVNGQFESQIALTGGVNQTTEPLTFGSHKFYAYSDYWFNGKIDDVGIWNRDLSSTEVQQLYQSQSPCSLTTNFFPQDTIRACGTSITLDALNPGSTYNWNTGATTQSISATTIGWYRCTVSQGAVCSVTDSVFVSLPNALPTNLQTGLIGYWPFCGNANDESGNGNNGTVFGATLTSDRNGVTNSAYAFDGINNYIETGNFFRPDADFTLSLWVISSSNAPQALFNTVPHTLIAYGLNPAWAGPGTMTFLYGTGQSNGWYNSGSYFVNPNSYFQWMQHTIVKSGSSVSIYQNGVLVHSVTTVANPASILAKAVFGHCDPAICNETLLGKLDDICSWNRALTPTEVQQLYSTQTSCTLTVNFFPQDTIRACGTSITLDALNPGSTYNWNTGATTQSISATTTGWYRCNVTQGACTAADSVFLSIIDARILQNDTSICNGSALTLAIGSPLIGCSSLPSNLRSGLVAYYPFCGNANDLSSNSLNGITSNATLVQDRYGNSNAAYSFNGATSFIRIPYSSILYPSTGTVASWIKVAGTFNSNQQLIFSQDRGGPSLYTNSTYRCGLLKKAGFSWYTTSVGGTNDYATVCGRSDLDNGEWHLLVGTYTTNSLSIYVDGVLQNIVSTSLTQNRSITNDFYIGGFGPSATNSQYFNGIIDDVYLWNNVLTAQEISQLYVNTSYLWSTGATTPTITVNPSQTTTYYVTISNGISNCTDSVTVTVNNHSSNLFAQDTVRACSAFYTVDAGAGYSTYAWSTGATTQSISATSTGWYRCTVTQGGCSATDSVFLSIISVRIANDDTTICSGATLTLSAIEASNSCNNLPLYLQAGLVGYWPFCGNANDESGNGHNGQINGPVVTSDRYGKVSSAYSFDGVNDYISIADFAGLNFGTGDFTYSAWFNADTVPTTCSQYSPYILGQGDNVGTPSAINYFMGRYCSSNFRFITQNPGSSPSNTIDLYPVTSIIKNTWYHVVVTRSGNSFNMYKNGIVVGNTNGSAALANPVSSFLIGGALSSGSDNFHRGKIDDVGIWNRALTSAQVQQLYRVGELTYLWSNGATTPTITVSPTQTTTYYCTVSNGISNCTDSVIVTVIQPTSSATTASTCNAYSWNNQTYTQSGTYTYSTTNAQGCDSIATLNLTITPTTSNTTTASACGSYTWSVNQQSYAISGMYSVVTDCHTEVLNLTVNPSNTNTSTISACNAYTWPVTNQTYTQSGTYSSVNSCTTEVLVLTITAGTNSSSTITACDSYVWSANGQTYTQSGNYSYTSGCSVSTLVLTITPSSSTTSSVTACTSYLWPATGITYTSSGTYTVASGCSRDVLQLTIAGSSSASTVTACGSYLWPANGQMYTQSGSYSQTTNCHTDVLNLTVIPSTTNSTTMAACDTYTWPVNNRTYTASGSYSYTSGCTTEVLNLTITPRTTNFVAMTACSSYVWPINGQTYTASGSYSSVNGCQTDVLNLTINTPSVAATGITASATSISAGTSVTLTVNGGTLGSGAIWKWYSTSCGGLPVGTGTSIIVSPSTTTVYYARAEGACNSTTCVSTTITVATVTCGPTGITTNVSGNSICSGSSITLSVQGSLTVGASWKWYKGGCGSGSSLGSNGTLTVRPTITTTYFVRATGGSCGTTSCASVTVTVRPLPSMPGNITGPLTGVCSNSNVTYSVAAVSGATSYLWSVPSGATIVSGQGSTSIVVNYGNSIGTNASCGGTTICVQAVNACGNSAARSIVVSLTPILTGSIAGVSTATANQQTTYSVVAVAGATSYLWTVPSGWTILSGQGTVAITVRVGSPSGTVKVVPQNACGNGAAVSKSVRVGRDRETTSRLQESDVTGVTVYPNPVSGTLHFRMGDIQPERVEMWDLLGNLVLTAPWVEEMEMSNYSTGMYVLRFFYNDAVEIKRVQVVR